MYVLCQPVILLISRLKRHDFTWEMICGCIGIASVESSGDISLCTKHYQHVYKMINAKSDACKSRGALS